MVILTLIRFYQYIFSPFFGSHCRFELTCSNYAIQVIKNYGIILGLLLTMWRLLHCHPWSNGGKHSVTHLINLEHLEYNSQDTIN